MVEIGVFVVPSAEDPERTVQQALAAEEAGLDLVAIQDHPYQRRFFDTFSLLAYLAARTSRVRLAPDVANLPLRPPAMIAKAAASIDVLSGGRFELGLGAGAFWENIAAMGGPAREPGESVEALAEAIELIRAWWSGGGEYDGEHYQLRGVKPGPPPAHAIGIWLGAYGPRMLRLTGRLADGWLPSLGNMEEDTIAERHQAIDDAAKKAGREPSDVRRLINVGADTDPERLERLITEDRFETLILSPDSDDPVGSIRRIGEELAPRLREAEG
jgi:alkanesulfonate monooxygenase SsuD/methylene tetrahydromethanopterin reductase-like flavin-dependent oxidoreductase (luciferase family)